MLMHDINIFMITETKFDASFRLSQFRLDQNKNGRTINHFIYSQLHYSFKINQLYVSN